MSQEAFIYSFVARGTMILAEYTEFTGNFPAIAAQCLQKLPSSNNKFTYNCDHHTFNFLVEDGYGNALISLVKYIFLLVFSGNKRGERFSIACGGCWIQFKTLRYEVGCAQFELRTPKMTNFFTGLGLAFGDFLFWTYL